jgi:hypothetical protein
MEVLYYNKITKLHNLLTVTKIATKASVVCCAEAGQCVGIESWNVFVKKQDSSYILSFDCSSGGGTRRSKLTPSCISTPKIRATFRRMH